MFEATYKRAAGTFIGLQYRRRTRHEAGGLPPGISLDIHRFIYGRYFYSLVRFFRIAGLSVDMRYRPETLT